MAHRCNHCQSTCYGHPLTVPRPSPDIARLLATNDPPSASQDEEFRQIRIDGTKHLADLDETIKEMHQALAGLMIERDALAWKVQNCRLVLNPVRRLPADILREIFLFACAWSTQNPSRFYIIAPTPLTRVCRSWHHIAATFPLFWRQRTLSVTRPFIPPRRNNQYSSREYEGRLSREYEGHVARVFGVSVAIARAATCPLWVDLRLDDSFYCSPASSLLFSLASRIQQLRISTSDLKCLDCPMFRHFVSYLTTLERMDLCSTTNHIVFDAISLPHALKHLTITPYKTFSKPNVDLGWSHLESLELRARYLGRIHTSALSTLHILSRARRIRLLVFSEDWDNEALPEYAAIPDNDVELGPLGHPFITMAHLTDLIVESSSYDVLGSICTPALERLVIRGGSPWMLTRAENMLQRSGCALRHLTLQGLADGHSGIDHIDVSGSLIRRCDSLQELSLLRIDADAQSVTRLLSSVQSLPSLRVLTLDISYVRNFRAATPNAVLADELLTFLESRRRLSAMPDEAVSDAVSSTELESFTLHALAEGVFDFMVAQRIKALRSSGLLFYICRYDKNDPRLY